MLTARLSAVHDGHCGSAQNMSRALTNRSDWPQDSREVRPGARLLRPWLQNVEHVSDSDRFAWERQLKINALKPVVRQQATPKLLNVYLEA